MTHPRKQLELLAPAKNADIGIEAINHGADAVYIGGPAFGARAQAGNEVADIERLARHAHRYGARVLVALNTILHDAELDGAEAELNYRDVDNPRDSEPLGQVFRLHHALRQDAFPILHVSILSLMPLETGRPYWPAPVPDISSDP